MTNGKKRRRSGSRTDVRSRAGPIAPASAVAHVRKVPPTGPIRTHCPAGHAYSRENTYINPKTGNRQCRACGAERSRDAFRERLYGLSRDDYMALRDRQGGRCAICREPAAGELALAADHDHATGDIRGLLCSRCSNGLGSFHDNPELLRTAVDYLSAAPAFVPSTVPEFVGKRCMRCDSWAARSRRDAAGVLVPLCLTCFSRAIGRTGKAPRGRPRLS